MHLVAHAQGTLYRMRNTVTIIGVLLLVVGAFLVLFFTGSSQKESSLVQSGSASVASSVPFERIAKGERSKIDRRVNYAVQSAAQLEALWKILDASGTPPVIDFTKQMVIAVFAGEKPTSGYDISVSKIEDSGKRVVSVEVQNPDGPCAVKKSTSPYEVVVAPIASLPLDHEDSSITVACPK